MPKKQKPRKTSLEVEGSYHLDLTNKDVAQVKECLRALAPVLKSGMTVAARSELAAVLLASATKTAHASAAHTGQPANAHTLRFAFEALAIERSRELYVQGIG